MPRKNRPSRIDELERRIAILEMRLAAIDPSYPGDTVPTYDARFEEIEKAQPVPVYAVYPESRIP